MRFLVFAFVRDARSGLLGVSSSDSFTQSKLISFPFFKRPRIWSSRSLFSSSASSTAITRSLRESSTAGARRSAARCFFEIDGIDLWRRSTSTSIPPGCSVVSLISPDRLISQNPGPGHFFPVGGKCDNPCLLQYLFFLPIVLRFKINGVALSDRLTRFLAYKTLLKRPITRPTACLSVEIKGATENRTGLPNYIVTCQQTP